MGAVSSSVREYPADAVEFGAWFPNDEACADYLAWLRWGDYEFVCHLCGAVADGWARSDGRRWDCRACGASSSVTSGTLFDKTRTPLSVWFEVAWRITAETYGVSARNLHRTLGLGSYQTAWMMLHRVRRAMVVPGREPLNGVVELDTMMVGGRRPGKRGRYMDENRSVVLVMTENIGKSMLVGSGKSLGRARLVDVGKWGGDTLTDAIRDNVALGAMLISDDDSGIQAAVEAAGDFDYTFITAKRAADPAHILFPAVSRVQAQAKRWLESTAQGAASMAHLQDYLLEFEFRFNRRGASKPGLLFYRLLEQSVRHVPVTYDIVARSVRMLNRGHHGTQQAHRGRRHPPRDPRHWTQVPLLRRGHPARRHQVQALRRDAHHSLTPDGRSLHPSHAAGGGTFSQEKVEPCEVVGLRPAKL